MAALPGMGGDVHFGAVDAPLPDWRENMPEGGRHDDDDAEPTEEERQEVIAMLGFDPREAEAEIEAEKAAQALES
jgi:hypothetical protein